jgi:Tfp pilus assembly PilM family ATPase
MAKAHKSVIGVDLGRFSLKAVLLQRRGAERIAVTHYAARQRMGEAETADQLASELKMLFKDMGGSAKSCSAGISSDGALLRIIEQPDTPPSLLREALRLNGMSLLNQDCREFVIDCDRISEPAPSQTEGEETPAGIFTNAPKKFLVGGVPRTQVTQIASALESTTPGIGALQLAPVCLFNAFEFAQPQTFNEHAFFLVDIGHTTSTMMIGVKRELVLVRTIEFGGKALVEMLMALSGESRDGVLTALENDDELMVENARMALGNLTREIGSSIGFFEGRREETIGSIHVSGGAAKSAVLLKVMSEEIHMPCQAWNPVESCEIEVSADKRERFAEQALDLHVACGAAAELLNA